MFSATCDWFCTDGSHLCFLLFWYVRRYDMGHALSKEGVHVDQFPKGLTVGIYLSAILGEKTWIQLCSKKFGLPRLLVLYCASNVFMP